MIETSNLLHKADPLVTAGQIWLGLPGYPGYLIGAHGAVMSLQKREARILSPIKMGNYDGYRLRDHSGRVRSAYRHRLVAEAFHGPCPDGMECRHLDGDRANNDVSNLCWGTPVENNADKKVHGTTNAGERNGQARLTRADVEAMRRLRADTGMPFHAVAEAFGVSTMTAYRAVTRQTWKDVP